MSKEIITSEEFRREVEAGAGILKSHGFERATRFETETPTTASMVYLGRNVAFTFTLDVRDQAIDLGVTRIREGRLVDNWDGGYSSSLFTHLLKNCGFRGRPSALVSLPPTAPKVQKLVTAQFCLLAHPASSNLLADNPDSLPR